MSDARAELRALVTEAAMRGLRGSGRRRSNKNPHYVAPSEAGKAWTHVYGTARALVEWATADNVALAIAGLNERGDDQSANVRAILKFVDTVSNLAVQMAAHRAHGPAQVIQRDGGRYQIGITDDAPGPFETRAFAEAVAFRISPRQFARASSLKRNSRHKETSA
jgi:hypothetical protein